MLLNTLILNSVFRCTTELFVDRVFQRSRSFYSISDIYFLLFFPTNEVFIFHFVFFTVWLFILRFLFFRCIRTTQYSLQCAQIQIAIRNDTRRLMNKLHLHCLHRDSQCQFNFILFLCCLLFLLCFVVVVVAKMIKRKYNVHICENCFHWMQ